MVAWGQRVGRWRGMKTYMRVRPEQLQRGAGQLHEAAAERRVSRRQLPCSNSGWLLRGPLRRQP